MAYTLATLYVTLSDKKIFSLKICNRKFNPDIILKAVPSVHPFIHHVFMLTSNINLAVFFITRTLFKTTFEN